MANRNKQSLMQVERPIFLQDDLNDATLYKKPSQTVKALAKNKLKEFNCGSCFLTIFPIFNWITYYSWKKSITGDILSGITVAIMNIPQGMAYGILGNLPPVVGIYMAFFPVLIYFFFGTSRHASMGTFSLVCLLTGKLVSHYSNEHEHENTTVLLADSHISEEPKYPPIEVAVTVTFTVACIQLIMYFLRLGILTSLLSEPLVQGFTCGSAFQVLGFQLKDMLGLPHRKKSRYFTFINTVYESVVALPQANRVVVAITMVSIVAMVLNNEIFKPMLAKKTKMPFPVELVAVVLGTFVAWAMNLQNDYNVTIVGPIPAGLPAPTMPQVSLMPYILVDSITICMIAYSISISMSLLIAKKDNYKIDANQELLAMSLSNVFGSFFACMPMCASLSRTVIQHAVGGVTQIASIVSCLLLLVILLWIGPYFETLPKCVLASIIVVSLKSMLFQIEEVPKIWRISKWDATVWVVTFGITLFVSIYIGLMVGVGLSIISLLLRGYKPYTCVLGVYPNTELYLDMDRYTGVQEIQGIKIYHYCGSLNFASHKLFKDSLYTKTGFYPSDVRKLTKDFGESTPLRQKCVIVDLSACIYIDHSGVNELRDVQLEYKKSDVALYLAALSSPVYEMLKICDKYEKMDSEFVVFATVHDAVIFAQRHVMNGTNALVSRDS